MSADSSVTHVRARDGTVSGRLIRPRDACDLPLLVCIHGGGSNGRYFQMKGRSLSDMAAARGFCVLLIDRPGHGGTPLLPATNPIAGSITFIRTFIDEVRTMLGEQGERGIALIGHSIGGAIALRLAAERGDWPLLGAAVSGIGTTSPAWITAMSLPDDVIRFTPPAAFAEALFHDPDRTLDWKALASLRAATEPWIIAEIAEIVDKWPGQWPAVARSIDVPVHLRLAEHDRIWESGHTAVVRMAAAIVRAPYVDAGLLASGGHLYEACREGPALIASQLDFLEHCADRAA
ncbi:alpha/beta hydrolase [Sphingomonas sp. 1P08PE]|uniref:alpha/beta hydrolase n=1 Tax=Sphingomonas sp. 1P08PE TaxID=554122 RepID=UPI0039A3A32F